MIAEQERSAWVSPLQWDGSAWSYSWGSFQELEWARRGAADRAAAFAGRASLMQRLLKHNDKVVAMSADASVQVYRRIACLDCIVVDSLPPLVASQTLPNEPRFAHV